MPNRQIFFAVELTFSEDPARLEARPAHRKRLGTLHRGGELVAAGPYSDDAGALLLFRLTTPERLDEILETDPYYSGPWIGGVTVREWSPLFGVE